MQSNYWTRNNMYFLFEKKIIIQTLTQRREREEEQATIMHLSPSHLPPGVFDQHVYFYG
jgi:hypothetical protein